MAMKRPMVLEQDNNIGEM